MNATMGMYPCCGSLKAAVSATLAISLLIAACIVGPRVVQTSSHVGNDSQSSDQALSPNLNVNNLMLFHPTGHLCFKSDGSFQSTLYLSHEENSDDESDIMDASNHRVSLGGAGVFVQEYHHNAGRMFNYESFNVDSLRSQAIESIGSVPKWIDDLDGVKYECSMKGEEDDRAVRELQKGTTMRSDKNTFLKTGGNRGLREERYRLLANEVVEESAGHDSKPSNNEPDDSGSKIHAPKMLELRTDGTSIWVVAGFILEVSQDNEPIAIVLPTSDSEFDTRNSKSIKLPIISTESCTLELSGCDPELDSDDRSLPTFNPDAISTNEVELALSQHPEGHLPEHKERLLAVWSDFQNGITGTNWCGVGVGQRDQSPCPGEDEEATDIEADKACRRHDYGFYLGGSKVTGIPRSECLIDADLVAATDNVIVEAVYGKYGLAAASGCWSYDQHNCFKYVESLGFWAYGNYCEGKVARYGFDRYEGMNRANSWGYREPEYTCKGDLFKCKDSKGCFVKSPCAEDIMDVIQ